MSLRLRLAVLVVALFTPTVLAAQDASSDYTEPYPRKALEIYRTAIGYRTAAGHGQVPALAEYLADQFRGGGFPSEDVHLLRMTAGGEETAGLVVRYRGDGSSGKEPILLIAHMDVVDALYAGYGEDAGGGMRGGKQDQMFEGGNAHLDQHFPKLDKLLRATVIMTP